DRALSVFGRPRRVPLPMVMRVHALQRRSDGPVFVPGTGSGLARLASVEVDTKEDDALAPLAGRHGGVTVNGWHLRIQPARQPIGLLSSLRVAPLRAPVPQLWSESAPAEGASGPLAMVSSHPGG